MNRLTCSSNFVYLKPLFKIHTIEHAHECVLYSTIIFWSQKSHSSFWNAIQMTHFQKVISEMFNSMNFSHGFHGDLKTTFSYEYPLLCFGRFANGSSCCNISNIQISHFLYRFILLQSLSVHFIIWFTLFPCLLS